MFQGLITLIYTNIYKYIPKVNRPGKFFLNFFFRLNFTAAAVHPSAFDFRTPAASGPASRRSGPRPTPGPLRRIHRPAAIDVGSHQARSASTSAARSLPEALALCCYVVRKSGRAGAGVYINLGLVVCGRRQEHPERIPDWWAKSGPAAGAASSDFRSGISRTAPAGRYTRAAMVWMLARV